MNSTDQENYIPTTIRSKEIMVEIKVGKKNTYFSKVLREIVLDVNEEESKELSELLFKNINNAISETLKTHMVLKKKRVVSTFKIRYGKSRDTIERSYMKYATENYIAIMFDVLNREAKKTFLYNQYDLTIIDDNSSKKFNKEVSVELTFGVYGGNSFMSNIYKKTITVLTDDEPYIDSFHLSIMIKYINYGILDKY
jgi:hypothetical protein